MVIQGSGESIRDDEIGNGKCRSEFKFRGRQPSLRTLEGGLIAPKYALRPHTGLDGAQFVAATGDIARSARAKDARFLSY